MSCVAVFPASLRFLKERQRNHNANAAQTAPIAAPVIPPIKPLLIREDGVKKVWLDPLVPPLAGAVLLVLPDTDVDISELPEYEMEEG